MLFVCISIANFLCLHRLHALPVVDANQGNLVGIITAKDVMRDVIRTAAHALPSENSFSQSMADFPGDLAA